MDNISQLILGLAIAALAWFVKAKMNSYDVKHDKHADEIAELKERCAATEARLDVMKKVTNGRRT